MGEPSPRKKNNDLFAKALGFVVILALIGLWELAFRYRWLNLTFFPPPSRFLRYLSENDFSIGFGPERMEMHTAVLASFGRIGAGLGVSFLFALIVAIAISGSRLARRT